MNEVMAASENLRFTTQIAILKGKMMENYGIWRDPLRQNPSRNQHFCACLGELKYQTYIWIHVVGTLKTMPRSNSPKVNPFHQEMGAKTSKMGFTPTEIHIQKKYEAFHSHGGYPNSWKIQSINGWCQGYPYDLGNHHMGITCTDEHINQTTQGMRRGSSVVFSETAASLRGWFVPP